MRVAVGIAHVSVLVWTLSNRLGPSRSGLAGTLSGGTCLMRPQLRPLDRQPQANQLPNHLSLAVSPVGTPQSPGAPDWAPVPSLEPPMGSPQWGVPTQWPARGPGDWRVLTGDPSLGSPGGPGLLGHLRRRSCVWAGPQCGPWRARLGERVARLAGPAR